MTIATPIVRELTADQINWEMSSLPTTGSDADPVEMLVDTLCEAQAYRTVAACAVHHAHGLHVKLVQLRRLYEQVAVEARTLRAADRTVEARC